MVFNEIDNFIEVYNNSVIELMQCFGTSFFGRIDHLASSVIKFRPKNSVPKHCIRSITYNSMTFLLFPKDSIKSMVNVGFVTCFIIDLENEFNLVYIRSWLYLFTIVLRY